MKHAKQHIDPFPKYIGKEIWYHVMDQLMEIVKKSNGQEAGNLRQFKSNEFKILKPRPIPESEKTENQRRFEATKIHVEQSFEYLGMAFNEKFLNYFKNNNFSCKVKRTLFAVIALKNFVKFHYKMQIQKPTVESV